MKFINYNKKIIFYNQLSNNECAIASLCMVYSFFYKKINYDVVKNLFNLSRQGATIQEINRVSKILGFNTEAYNLEIDDIELTDVPIILHWRDNHFVILDKGNHKNTYTIFDPAFGKIILKKNELIENWTNNSGTGVAIVLTPNHEIDYDLHTKNVNKKNSSFSKKKIFEFINSNKLKYFLASLFLILTLIISFVIPFVFKKTIDSGIIDKNINILYILLISQLILNISSLIFDFLYKFILTRMNLSLTLILKESFFKKILFLPIKYFESKLHTELLEKISDQNTIQNFFTWKGIDLFISILNIISFSAILLYFNFKIFLIYLILTSISVLWIKIFMNKRRIIDYINFNKKSEINNYLYEIVVYMLEIKINNAHQSFIDNIIKKQNIINKIELKNLLLNTSQLSGLNFINKIKELIIIGFCGMLIINDNMTLGTLLSISYVIGQLSYPTSNIIQFIKTYQDFNIANNRINEIYNIEDENEKNEKVDNVQIIEFQNVSFKYFEDSKRNTLNNINFRLKENTITAIVGKSGSGKTTLIKLLLGYYSTNEGRILINNYSDLNTLNKNVWRENFGTVLQDGTIFSGSITENITLNFDNFIKDPAKLDYVIKLSDCDDFINELPLKRNTKIGNIGVNLSGGQKQRILIARALYNEEKIIIFDEATSSLDSLTESKIYDNLRNIHKNKIVIIIAHRLSTVKNADQIIVVENGTIVEKGTHYSLLNKNGKYFQLINNQLNLETHE